MNDNTFPDVRFNGCLGFLKVNGTEIIFEDDSLGIKLSWGLDTLEEEVLKPVTSSVDLTFNLGGIKERTSFQMRNFPEVARFRSCIAERRKALTKQESVARIAWNEPSSELDPDSLSSMKTFYDDDASTAEGSSKHSKSTSPVTSPPASKAILVTLPTYTEPNMSLSELSTSNHDVLQQESMHLTEGLTLPVNARPSLRFQESMATVVASNKLHDSSSTVDHNGSTKLEDSSSSVAAATVPSQATLPSPTVKSSVEPGAVASVHQITKESLKNQQMEPCQEISEKNEDEREKKRQQKLNSAAAVGASLGVSVHHEHRERRKEQKLKAEESKRNLCRGSSRTSLRDSTTSRHSDVSSPPEVDNPRSSVSSRSVSPVPKAARREEDPILALKRSKQATQQDIAAFRSSNREARVAIVSHAGSTMPGAVKATQVLGLSDKELGAMPVTLDAQCTRRPSQAQSEKSEKSNDEEDPTESTMPDFSGQSHERTAIQNTLVEATLVEEGSSRSLSGFFRHPAITASPIDVIAEESVRRKFRLWSGLLCVCFLLVIMAGALVVSVLVDGGEEEPAMVAAAEEPLKMTPEERHTLLEEGLQDFAYDASVFEDLLSPQRLALQWMATEDSQSKRLLKEGNFERLSQRYLLAVFYYTMAKTGPWSHCQPPETGETSACIHPVLESYSNEGFYTDQRMSEPSFRWLSYVEECRWAGVKCEDGVHVSRLSLAGYGLRGALPVELAYLSTLQVLDLQHNQLFGQLPKEWGTVGQSALESVRLDRNDLTGPIPAEWCNINTNGLRDMILSNNQLTGSLPACLGDFVSMENFSVLHNFLIGNIPESLANLSHIKRLHLAGNNFNGEVPDSFCTNREADPLFEATADCDNSFSSDVFVECSCCTTCCVAGGDKDECNSRLAETMTTSGQG